MLTCLICNCNNLSEDFNIKRPDLGEDCIYTIYTCSQCQFKFVEGPYNNEVLGKIYNESFHKSSQQSAPVDKNGNYTKDSLRSPIVINALHRVQYLKSLGLKGSLLDIGAGKGYFVKAASSEFDAFGIEYAAESANFGKALGWNINQGNFLECSMREKAYDVITMWDVLACFKDPNLPLEKISKIIKENGYFIFTVPYSESILAKTLKKFWPLMIPPVNLSYYSKKSIEKMLNKNGFKVLHTRFETKWVSLDFLILKLLRSAGMRGLGFTSIPILSKLKVPINTYDILSVVAVKGA